MNYEKIYNSLCESRKYRGIVKGEGYEVHHILPSSMGGSNNLDNLVKLNRREHILAHRLLTKFVRGRHYLGMLQAYLWMSNYNSHGRYLNTIRRHLTCIGYRKGKVFPFAEVSYDVTNNANPVRLNNYLKEMGITKLKKRGYSIDIFNVLLFACVEGFDSVNGLSHGSSSTTLKKYMVSIKVITSEGFFTPSFKIYSIKFKKKCLKSFYKLPKYKMNLFTEINRELKGVKVFAEKLEKGVWMFYKLNDTPTKYDILLYKPTSINEFEKSLNKLKMTSV